MATLIFEPDIQQKLAKMQVMVGWSSEGYTLTT